MPAPVVPAVATSMIGTAPAARSARIACGERLRVHASRAVGGDETQCTAPDARLMRDLEPGDVAFARGVERGGSREGARSLVREARMGCGERTHERGVIGLRSARGEVTGRLGAESRAARDGADDVAFERHRNGR